MILLQLVFDFKDLIALFKIDYVRNQIAQVLRK